MCEKKTPKTQMLTHVKTWPFREINNLDGDVFVLPKQIILEGVFGFGSKGTGAIYHYTFSNEVTLF